MLPGALTDGVKSRKWDRSDLLRSSRDRSRLGRSRLSPTAFDPAPEQQRRALNQPIRKLRRDEDEEPTGRQTVEDCIAPKYLAAVVMQKEGLPDVDAIRKNTDMPDQRAIQQPPNPCVRISNTPKEKDCNTQAVE